MNEKAVKAIIINPDGRMLVLKQKVGDSIFYTLPGGRLNEEEKSLDGLRREISEEAGILIGDPRYVGDWFFLRKSGKRTECETYIVREWEGDIHHKDKEDYEDISIIWTTPREFIEEYSNEESLVSLIKKLMSEKEI